MVQSGARRTVLLLAVAVVTTALAGCTESGEMPVPTHFASPSSSPSPSAEPAPEFRPGGTAAQNLRFFEYVGAEIQEVHGMANGQVIVDRLTEVGFDKAAMEVTYDSTAIGLVADSIVVSVHIGDECLIGQFSTEMFTGARVDVLGTGKCLVGETRPIDW